MTLVSSVLDAKFSPLLKYIGHLRVSDLSFFEVDDLRNTYFSDPEVNSIHVPGDFHLVGYYDRLLDAAIKERLLPFLPLHRPTRCEEDNCPRREMIDDDGIQHMPDGTTNSQPTDPELYGELKYACLRWVCADCYKGHQEKFTCAQCQTEQCHCNVKSGYYDQGKREMIETCHDCENENVEAVF